MVSALRPGGPHLRGTVHEQGRAEFRWPLHPASAHLTRRVVLALCRLWRSSQVCDSAALAASELIGNSVRAGCGESVLLRLSWTARRLRIEVQDEAPGLPQVDEAAPDAERGRGLWIVSQVAVRWGTKVLPHGKYVWAEIALPA